MSNINIAKRGILCKLKMPSIQSRRKHESETTRVAHDNEADSGMVSVIVCLVPKEYASKISGAAQRVRAAHRNMSLPWDDDGGRIIPIAVMENHASAIQGELSKYEAEIEEYANNLPAVEAAAKIRLGPLFDPSLYDSEDAVRAKLKPVVSYYPLPDSKDFRVDLDDNQIEYLKETLDVHMRDKFDEATRDLKNRIITVTESFVDRVSAYHETRMPDGNVRVDRTFRDSVVENVQVVLDMIPGLNITQDMEVSKLAEQTRTALCTYKAATLRTSPAIRSEVVAKARALLTRLRAGS
jgi:hypothetical protein